MRTELIAVQSSLAWMKKMQGRAPAQKGPCCRSDPRLAFSPAGVHLLSINHRLLTAQTALSHQHAISWVTDSISTTLGPHFKHSCFSLTLTRYSMKDLFSLTSPFGSLFISLLGSFKPHFFILLHSIPFFLRRPPLFSRVLHLTVNETQKGRAGLQCKIKAVDHVTDKTAKMGGEKKNHKKSRGKRYEECFQGFLCQECQR